MTLLLLDTYSESYKNVKKIETIYFKSYDDMSIDATRALRLNVKIPLVKLQNNK